MGWKRKVNVHGCAMQIEKSAQGHCLASRGMLLFVIIYPMGRIFRVCKIIFFSTGENRGKPRLVCKKRLGKAE